MQVSWIEPDQLRDLVGRLQQPAAAPSSGAWELHTLPDGGRRTADDIPLIADHDLWIPDLPPAADAASPPLVAAEPEAFRSELPIAAPPIAEDFQPMPQPPPVEPAVVEPIEPPVSELERIRDKLRAIREKAVGAGLLAHQENRESQASEPEPEPAAMIGSERKDPPSSPPATAAASVISRTSGEPASSGTPAPVELMSSPFALAASPAASQSCPMSRSGEPAAVEGDSFSFEVPIGPVAGRVEAFAAWALRRVGPSGRLLVIDDHGDILWGRHEQERLLVSATMAAVAAMRSEALGAWSPGKVEDRPFGTGNRLAILPARTQQGVMCLAIIRPQPLPDGEAAILREALIATLDAGLELAGSGDGGGNPLD